MTLSLIIPLYYPQKEISLKDIFYKWYILMKIKIVRIDKPILLI